MISFVILHLSIIIFHLLFSRDSNFCRIPIMFSPEFRIHIFRINGSLWTCLSLSHSQIHPQTHKFTHFFFLISLQIKVIDLTLCTMNYFFVKYVHVLYVFTHSVSELYFCSYLRSVASHRKFYKIQNIYLAFFNVCF